MRVACDRTAGVRAVERERASKTGVLGLDTVGERMPQESCSRLQASDEHMCEARRGTAGERRVDPLSRSPQARSSLRAARTVVQHGTAPAWTPRAPALAVSAPSVVPASAAPPHQSVRSLSPLELWVRVEVVAS